MIRLSCQRSICLELEIALCLYVSRVYDEQQHTVHIEISLTINRDQTCCCYRGYNLPSLDSGLRSRRICYSLEDCEKRLASHPEGSGDYVERSRRTFSFRSCCRLLNCSVISVRSGGAKKKDKRLVYCSPRRARKGGRSVNPGGALDGLPI